ncbi:MAG: secretin N-terminal domain-containing protein, partial [Pyrinomonadaceae bacterium]
AGRQPLVTPNKETNSITVRDTPENIRLIEELLRAIDKDRAEVVMDVNIYEVSRTNLLQLGNQVGTAGTLGSLGGFNPLSILVGGPNGRGQIVNSGDGKGGGVGTKADAVAATVITALGGSFILPATQLSLFQSKDNTRLLAHTQVHAFDGEQSVTRIGQKVPIQTAQVTPFGGLGAGTATPQQGGAGSVFGSGGYPVIQYQDTGLNLKFTPQVFPNQDVEVKMEIESNDVIGGANALTPTFSQRTMSGKARIPNGRTVMIASVSQDKQSRGRQGLPLLGLIPVLGRLFSTPTDNSSNADIVITVSPRVLSSPVVTPDDIQTRDAGTLQAPISDSLEAVVKAAEREEQLAAARQLPTDTAVQVQTAAAAESKATDAAAGAQPSQTAEAGAPAYVPAPQIIAGASNSFAPSASTNAATAAAVEGVKTTQGAYAIPVINTDDAPPPVPAVALKSSTAAAPAAAPATSAAATEPQAGGASLHLLTGGEMRVGERRRVLVLINTATPLSLAAAALKFDPRVLAVRSITKGTLFGDSQGAQPSVTQSVDPRGSLLALVAPPPGSHVSGAGVLLFVEVEALAAGESLIAFDRAGLYLMSADGRAVVAQTSQARLTVK